MIVLDRLPLAPGIVLLVADEGDGVPRPVPWLVDEDRRAVAGDGAARAVLCLLHGGTRTLGSFAVTAWHLEPSTGERSFGVDQTHESVVVGERAVVKWRQSAEPGPHPAPALLSTLERHGFDGIPRPWGLLEWRGDGDGDDAPRLLATVDSLLPGAVDGWTWAVGDLRSTVLTDSLEEVVTSGRRLGDLVGRMHAALATDNASTATAADLAAWEAGADRDLDQALAVTTGAAHDLLASYASRVRAGTRVPASLVGSPLIRVHGDLHVGQVLRVGPTYVVTDFDGNPVVPPAERTLPQPPALDVAGLAQSIQHAGLVLRHHEPGHDPVAVAAATNAFADAFVATYGGTVAALGHADLVQPALVRCLRLRQVCREFSYAALHLSRWSYVPEAALPALLPPDPDPSEVIA